MIFEDRQDLLSKIYWEGGIFGALEYGIREGDMPDGDTELQDAWSDLQSSYEIYHEKEELMMDLLDYDGSAG